jgi:hypothetical protein
VVEAAVRARPSEPQRPQRPRELEDALNLHVYHPLAWRLARALARTPVTPNQVSVVGGLFVVAAGLAYSGPEWGGPAWPWSAALGLALHLAWHVIDGADGDLARMTGRTSPRGEMVDGLCDYASHVVLYLLLAWVLAQSLGPIAWAIALAAGIAHAIQSNHVEAQRRFYLYWIHDKPWLNTRRPDTSGPFAWLVALYLRLATGTSPRALAVDRAVTAAKGDPARLEAIRAAICGEAPRLLRIEKWLGSNSRAIALGASMLLTASPLAYFVYGGVWMSALLVVSMMMHNRAWARVAARVDARG